MSSLSPTSKLRHLLRFRFRNQRQLQSDRQSERMQIHRYRRRKSVSVSPLQSSLQPKTNLLVLLLVIYQVNEVFDLSILEVCGKQIGAMPFKQHLYLLIHSSVEW